jgi:riboflavin biosynthesis pyrimidine reductase
VRRLYPDSAEDVDIAVAYAYPDVPFGGHWLRANMIQSVDGSAADAHGSSRGLAGPADRRLLIALRAISDVVLAGATTVRNERYRRLRPPPEVFERRKAAGLAPAPVVAVVSASLDFDYRSELFQAEDGPRPVVITTDDAPSLRLATMRELADVVLAGARRVDPIRAVAALAERGLTRILCEGGPTLLGQLAAAGLIDDLCVTVSPILARQPAAPGIMAWPRRAGPAPLRLVEVYEEDGHLFLRYAGRWSPA